MASITINVDLDDFYTDELIDELTYRITNSNISQKDTECLYKAILNMAPKQIEVKSLDDKMKLEFITKIWDKYTSFQLEELIPA